MPRLVKTETASYSANNENDADALPARSRARQPLTLEVVESVTETPDELGRRFALATQILMRGAERRLAAEAAAASAVAQ